MCLNKLALLKAMSDSPSRHEILEKFLKAAI